MRRTIAVSFERPCCRRFFIGLVYWSRRHHHTSPILAPCFPFLFPTMFFLLSSFFSVPYSFPYSFPFSLFLYSVPRHDASKRDDNRLYFCLR